MKRIPTFAIDILLKHSARSVIVGAVGTGSVFVIGIIVEPWVVIEASIAIMVGTGLGGAMFFAAGRIGELLFPEPKRSEMGQIPKPLLIAYSILASRKNRDAVIGDTIERFSKDAKQFGRTWAKVLAIRDIFGTLPPVFWQLVRRAVNWAIAGTVIDRIFFR